MSKQPPLAGYGHPKITARTRCLSCGVQKGKHTGYRHPFRPRYPWMTADGCQIDSETYSVGRGPLELDIKMALDKGWSERAILRVLDLFPLLIPANARASMRDDDEIKARRPRKPDRRTGTDRRAELRRIADRAERRLKRR